MSCPHCGLEYDTMRTGLTYTDVYHLLWVGNPDPATWRNKRRNTVLGLWHEIKLQLWDNHMVECEVPF